MLGIEKPGASTGPTVMSLIGSPLAAAEVSVVSPAAVVAAAAEVSGAAVSELESLSSPHAASTSTLTNTTTAGAR